MNVSGVMSDERTECSEMKLYDSLSGYIVRKGPRREENANW